MIEKCPKCNKENSKTRGCDCYVYFKGIPVESVTIIEDGKTNWDNVKKVFNKEKMNINEVLNDWKKRKNGKVDFDYEYVPGTGLGWHKLSVYDVYDSSNGKIKFLVMNHTSAVGSFPGPGFKDPFYDFISHLVKYNTEDLSESNEIEKIKLGFAIE